MKIFPCSSFYQIELDVPRLDFLQKENKKVYDMCIGIALKLFRNYTKRNSV